MKKTVTQTELAAMISGGMSARKVAQVLGFTPVQVYGACAVLGIALSVDGTHRGAKPSVDCAQYIADMEAGLSLTQIAKKHGKANPATVYAVLKRRGLPTSSKQLLIQRAAAQAIATAQKPQLAQA